MPAYADTRRSFQNGLNNRSFPKDFECFFAFGSEGHRFKSCRTRQFKIKHLRRPEHPKSLIFS